MRRVEPPGRAADGRAEEDRRIGGRQALEGAFELAPERFHLAAVEGDVEGQPADLDSAGLEASEQLVERSRFARERGRGRAVGSRDLDRPSGGEPACEVCGREPDRRHPAEPPDALHQAGPVEDDADGVLEAERAGRPGRPDLAHRVADDRLGHDPPGGP